MAFSRVTKPDAVTEKLRLAIRYHRKRYRVQTAMTGRRAPSGTPLLPAKCGERFTAKYDQSMQLGESAVTQTFSVEAVGPRPTQTQLIDYRWFSLILGRRNVRASRHVVQRAHCANPSRIMHRDTARRRKLLVFVYNRTDRCI